MFEGETRCETPSHVLWKWSGRGYWAVLHFNADRSTPRCPFKSLSDQGNAAQMAKCHRRQQASFRPTLAQITRASCPRATSGRVDSIPSLEQARESSWVHSSATELLNICMMCMIRNVLILRAGNRSLCLPYSQKSIILPSA